MFEWDVYNLEMDLEDATKKWEFEELLEQSKQRFDDHKEQIKIKLDYVETKQRDIVIDPNNIIYGEMHDLQEELN